MYTQFYNFSEKPFNLTPDPKFLYLTPSHREALASMLYGINERKGFIAITGEVGVGKTTLIYTLLNNLNEKVKTAFVYHTSATFDQLLSYILIDLNVTVDSQDKIALLGKLNEYLTHNISQDETLAIIIDEAQNLPNKVLEEFRLLSNLETSKQKLLQILLVGQPELAEKLNSQDLRQLKQRIGISRKIKPLNPKEREEYIDHRLKIAGSSSKNVFSSDAISAISKHSEGIPRVINIICDNALLIGYSYSQKKISGKIVKEVIEDLSGRIEEVPPAQATAPPVAREGKTFSRKTLGSFIGAAVLLIALVLFALTNRGDLKDDSSQENVVKLTQRPSEQNARSTIPQPRITNQPIPTERKPQAPIQEKPVAKEPPPQRNLKKTTLHKAGGSLYTIALNNYKKANPTIYDLILRTNPDITDIRKIPDNQEILLPDINRESFILETGDGSYRVYAGTFNTPQLAKVCTEKLAPLGKKSKVQDHTFSPRDTWYRVTLGDYESKKEALKAVDHLREQDIIFIP
jgi:type II secretory pathway predicted ATPase ExeA